MNFVGESRLTVDDDCPCRGYFMHFTVTTLPGHFFLPDELPRGWGGWGGGVAALPDAPLAPPLKKNYKKIIRRI